MNIIMFTGNNKSGLSKRYYQGQYNLHNDGLIKPNQIKEMIIKGQGKIIMYDGIFENMIYSFENKQDAQQHIQLGANADKVDSFIITGLSSQPPVVVEPPVVEPPVEEPVVEPPVEEPVVEPPVEEPVVEPPVCNCECEDIRDLLLNIRDLIDKAKL